MCNFVPADRNEDLADVVEAVKTLAADWDKLSVKLHLKLDKIDLIKKDNPVDSESCLTAALREWMKENHNTASWKTLVKAVWTRDKDLARTIANRHRGMYVRVYVQHKKNGGHFFFGVNYECASITPIVKT